MSCNGCTRDSLTKRLNRRILIQYLDGETVDDDGFNIPNWETFLTVRAERKPMASKWKEFFQAAAIHAEKTIQYTIRHREGITEDMRIVDGKKTINGKKVDRIYEIKAVLDDVNDDGKETVIMATEIERG